MLRIQIAPSFARPLVVLPLVLVLLAGTFGAVASASGSSTVNTSGSTQTTVAPHDTRLRYEGRWDVQAHRATTVNSGSRVYLNFVGNQVDATFDLEGLKRLPQIYAFVDGIKSNAIIVDRNQIRLTSTDLSAGSHTLMLAVKDVDERSNRWKAPFGSALQLTGFVLGAGTQALPRSKAPRTRLTFLGDSITQGVNANCLAIAGCGDGTLDYAWLVADYFHAGLEQVGFGSQGVTVPGGGGVPAAGASLPLNFDGSPASAWDAQVVVINYGTNDVIRLSQASKIYTAYRTYLQAVRLRYPNAQILALEPFGVFGLLTVGAPISRAVRDAKDPLASFVSTRGWTTPLDYTDSVHPNANGHRAIADRLNQLIAGYLP